MIGSISLQLNTIQGRLFELSSINGLDSISFVKAYMKSELAKKFNSSYDRSQWMGEEYLLDEIKEMYELPKGKTLSRDVMFWMGYIYSYWAIMYNENCSRILKIAGPEKMAKNYAGLHTISNDLAIHELIAQSEK